MSTWPCVPQLLTCNEIATAYPKQLASKASSKPLEYERVPGVPLQLTVPKDVYCTCNGMTTELGALRRCDEEYRVGGGSQYQGRPCRTLIAALALGITRRSEPDNQYGH